MTNLTQKLTTLEQQLAQQSTDLIAAISALSGGNMPNPQSRTWEDIYQKLTAIAADGALTRAAVQTMVPYIADGMPAFLIYLRDIARNSEITINNMSTNAQLTIAAINDIKTLFTGYPTTTRSQLNAIYSAIVQTACPCDGASAGLPPPLSPNPLGISHADRCKRIQAFMAWFRRVVNGICNLLGAGAAIGTGTLTTIIATAAAEAGVVGGEVGAVAGPPGAIVGALVGIIGAVVAAIGAYLFQQLQNEFNDEQLQGQLRDALFQVNDAVSGDAAFRAVINSSTILNSQWHGLINTLWSMGWANDIYNPNVTINTAGFDGTVCQGPGNGDGDCGVWPRQVMYFGLGDWHTIDSPYGTRWVPNWDKYLLAMEIDGRPNEYAAVRSPCAMWTYTASGAGQQFYQSGPGNDYYVFGDLPINSGTLADQGGLVLFWSYLGPVTLTFTPPTI